MKSENDYEEIKLAKENRIKNQEAERHREVYHPFVFHIHTPKRKDLQRRMHELERRFLKRK